MKARYALMVALAAALAGCGQIHAESQSPNDPGYWYSEAPRSTPTHVRQPGNERIYRPLGGAVY